MCQSQVSTWNELFEMMIQEELGRDTLDITNNGDCWGRVEVGVEWMQGSERIWGLHREFIKSGENLGWKQDWWK
jgi:hypothetical protein